MGLSPGELASPRAAVARVLRARSWRKAEDRYKKQIAYDPLEPHWQHLETRVSPKLQDTLAELVLLSQTTKQRVLGRVEHLQPWRGGVSLWSGRLGTSHRGSLDASSSSA